MRLRPKRVLVLNRNLNWLGLFTEEIGDENLSSERESVLSAQIVSAAKREKEREREREQQQPFFRCSVGGSRAATATATKIMPRLALEKGTKINK